MFSILSLSEYYWNTCVALLKVKAWLKENQSTLKANYKIGATDIFVLYWSE